MAGRRARSGGQRSEVRDLRPAICHRRSVVTPDATVLHACRKGGRISIVGVYGGFIDKVPFGAAFGKGVQIRMGQAHVQNYTRRLLEHIERGDVDPSFLITHRVALEDAPEMYKVFRDKEDECLKVVMDPWAA